MGRRQDPELTTDLRGYAIRIYQHRVYYFNSDGILKSCSTEEANVMELKDLFRKSITGPFMLRRSFFVAGFNNKNAFKSAATRMREGKSIEDFCKMAIEECTRQSTKPHKDSEPVHRSDFIIDIHEPTVVHRKNYDVITIKIITNPDYQSDCTESSLEEAGVQIKNLIYKTQDILTQHIPFFKGWKPWEVPEPTEVILHEDNVLLKFKV